MSPRLDFILLPLLLVLVLVVSVNKVASSNELEASEDHRVTSIRVVGGVGELQEWQALKKPRRKKWQG